jgi:hypothetical protein
MKNEEQFKQKAIRHGEVMIVPVAEIPATATEIYSGKEYIVGHSETGHHHVAYGDITMFRPMGADDGSLFMRVNKDSVLEHRKSFDKHETKSLLKGLYTVTIKKAYDYFAKRMTRVVD